MIDETNLAIEELEEEIRRENDRRYAFYRMLNATDRVLWRLEELNRDGIKVIPGDMRGRMRDAASYTAPVGIGTALSDRDRAKLRWMAGATKMPGGLHDQCFHLLYRCTSGRASRLG